MSNKYKIYCWWLNEEEMSSNRKKSLDNLKETTGCEIVFIDNKTLSNYILPEYPLHEGYAFLSEIQKGDYLKCYFMHHYGGGYTDIKQTTGSWVNLFDALYSNDNIYCIGYKEKSPNDIAILEKCTLDPKESKYCRSHTLSQDGSRWDSSEIKQNWSSLIGNGAFICKKNTPLTLDWWQGLNEKMDGYLTKLKANPAQWGRDARHYVNPKTEELSNYPIGWAVINGNIFHPLCLKYKNNILQDLHYPIVTNYQ
jgi:hypothetical protein